MDNEFNSIPQSEQNTTSHIPEAITLQPKAKRFPNIVSVVLIMTWMGCFVGFQLVGGTIYAVGAVIVNIITSSEILNPADMNYITFACSITSALCMLLIGIIVSFSKKQSGQSFISAFGAYTHIHKLKLSKCLQYISIGVALAFISGLIVSIITAFFDNDALLGSAADIEFSFLTGISVLFCAPLGEELLMRCMILDLFKKFKSPAKSNVYQSILFGFLHGISLQTLYTAFCGFVMGHEVNKTDNLTCSLMIHFGFNLSAGLSCFFPSFTDSLVYGVFILGMTLCGIVSFILISKSRKASQII